MLILSAIPSLLETWTFGFGFEMLLDKDRQRLDKVNLMLLPGTVLLKKNLYKITENDPDPRALIFLYSAFFGVLSFFSLILMH